MHTSSVFDARIASKGLHPFINRDVAHLLHDRARLKGRLAMVWEPFDGAAKKWTYSEFVDTIFRVAQGLEKRGVKKGDRVLLHMDNCPEAVFGWLGCAVLGATGVTTNTRSSSDELAYYARQAQVVLAITHPCYADLVDEATGLSDILLTKNNPLPYGDSNETASHKAASLLAKNGFDALFESSPLPLRPAEPELDFGVQFTSGTTARPKGVVWTHANALWGARMCASNEKLRSDDVHLVHLPLFHTNAQAYSVLASLWAGCTFVLVPKFSRSRFWEVSLRNGCTWASVIPFVCNSLMSLDFVPEHKYRHWGNGAYLPKWDDYFGVTTISWWGMTETITHPIVSEPAIATSPATIGRPSPAYQVHVLDAASNPIQPGETGSLRIGGMRGVSLFDRYLNDPTATEAAFDENGLLITGDLVQLRENGDLKFKDREKDMLKVGGENVAASEVERVINQVEGVAESAVVAKKDRLRDQVPVAFITQDPQSETSDVELCENVLAMCRESLADFKVPTEVIVLTELPRSMLNKVAKAELRKLLSS